MFIKKLAVCIGILFSLYSAAPSCYAEMAYNEPGQTIQIYTRFHSFIGKPSWLIIIRDIDHNQNMPYLLDITRGDNFWVLSTYSRNYLITVSNLQISTYKPRCNDYGLHKIMNFCHLESAGRIIHGESLYITVDGDLSNNPDEVTCNVSKFADSNFTIVSPNAQE
jgi:hypothetical protein